MLNMAKPQAAPSETEKEKKPTSAKKIAANQKNSKKAHGPIDCSKTRYNALKHGGRAAAVCMLDSSQECKELLQELMHDKKPQGAIETALVEKLAAEMNRLRRFNQIEADFIDQSIESPAIPPLFQGIPTPRLPVQAIDALVRQQRYGTAAFNTFRKTLHELERLQRARLEKATPEAATPKPATSDTATLGEIEIV
jgi:hypothetical protein